MTRGTRQGGGLIVARQAVKLAGIDLRAVRDMTASLRRFRLGGPPALRTLADPLREALGAFCAGGFGLRVTPEGLRCAFVHAQLGDEVRTDLDRSLEVASALRWANYDPFLPRPDQRNIATTIAPDDAKGTGISQVLVKHGLLTHHARILVCDGSSLLAWVGGFRSEPMGARELAILQSLADPLRQRLRLERDLDSGQRTVRALDAAMECLGREAFIVSAQGSILHTNALGRARLALEGRVGLRRIAAAVSTADPMFDVHPIEGDGQSREYLVTGHALGATRRDRVEYAATRWKLTQRQCAVLELLAAGKGNAHIAVDLNISVRTVEVHVTAILDRSACSSRAELIAAVFSM